jgi:hypothetical protein
MKLIPQQTIIVDDHGHCVATMERGGYAQRLADAKTIAHRVNVHDELVAALDALFENCSMVHNRWGDGCNGVEASAAIKNARAALERAKQ